jgi:inner membrane protein
MDVVTQGLLGGVLARAAARPNERKIATLVGAVAGLLADADILLRSTSDPLLTIEYHRHFTHSLVFIPIGAVVAMLILLPFLYRRITVPRLYLFCLLGYSMSGVLDACTSYGTHLFWPFTDERVALNIISIVDPVFSLILLVTLVLGLRSTGRQVVGVGLLLALVYLGIGFGQLQRAEQIALELASSRGHQPVHLVVKPTLANLVLWRSVYMTADHIYADAVRVGMPGSEQVFEGQSVKRFFAERDLPSLVPTSVLAKDIKRFTIFSDGFVAMDIEQSNVIGDIRYSMLPISVRPLWGIMIDPSQASAHAEYQFFRDSSKPVRQTFMNMLIGRCARPVCP